MDFVGNIIDYLEYAMVLAGLFGGIGYVIYKIYSFFAGD